MLPYVSFLVTSVGQHQKLTLISGPLPPTQIETDQQINSFRTNCPCEVEPRQETHAGRFLVSLIPLKTSIREPPSWHHVEASPRLPLSESGLMKSFAFLSSLNNSPYTLDCLREYGFFSREIDQASVSAIVIVQADCMSSSKPT